MHDHINNAEHLLRDSMEPHADMEVRMLRATRAIGYGLVALAGAVSTIAKVQYLSRERDGGPVEKTREERARLNHDIRKDLGL